MKSIENPKVISLFCGCGGFDLAFHRAGFKTVWANDNNKWAIKTFNDNFEDIAHLSSIEDYDPYYDSTIPDADLILGGFPCQDFSIIGKRNGINSSRGNLYRHFIKFIDAKKPFVFVAENVKGILSANNGQAIKQIVKDFESINPGYTVKIQLYNFSEYGVPQFRERVIFVGIRTDAGFNFMHPSPTCGPRTNKPYTTAGEALKDVEKIQHNNELIRHNHKTVEMLKLIPEGGNFADIDKTHPLYVKGMVSNIYRRINRNEPSKTVVASGGGGTWGYHYPEPRALTNRERARLQTFPDNFIFAGPLSEVRRQIGNAVPPLGIGPIANELFKLFQGDFFSF